MSQYILDEDRNPVLCPDLLEWARWCGSMDNRGVAKTRVSDSVHVSTVFLGIDHRLGGEGPPILFETMVFRDGLGDGQECSHYCTWAEAVAGHEAMVKSLGGKAA